MNRQQRRQLERLKVKAQQRAVNISKLKRPRGAQLAAIERAFSAAALRHPERFQFMWARTGHGTCQCGALGHLWRKVDLDKLGASEPERLCVLCAMKLDQTPPTGSRSKVD